MVTVGSSKGTGYRCKNAIARINVEITYATSGLISRHGGVDFGRPGVDAAAERLGVFEALVAEPDSDIHRADSVVAESDDVGFRVQLAKCPGRDVAHRDVGAAFDVRGFVLPRLAHIEEDVTFGTISGEQLLQFLRRYLIIHHTDENTGRAFLFRAAFRGRGKGPA